MNSGALTKLIKEGVVTWGQYLEVDNPRFINFMPHTWKTIYARGTYLLNAHEAVDSPMVHTLDWTEG